MNSQLLEIAVLHQLAQALDDVRLRRDRIGADHFRPAERDGLGHRMGTFDLLEHGPLLSALAAFLRRDDVVGFSRRRDVGLADLAGECLLDRALHAVEMDEAGQRREGAEQRRVRHGPADMLAARARSPAR